MRTRIVRNLHLNFITMFKQHIKFIRNFLPSAIIGGASVVGGAIDAIANYSNAKKAIAAQKEENQKNRDFAVQMYKQFESPQAQVQQLAAAGLNPYANGAVSTNSVGSASTSSLPTPAPSSFGSSISEGAQQAVQSYTQRKQFQQQLDADSLNQTRNFLLELSKLDLDERQLQTQIDLWNEQIKASKTSREYQDLINKELKDFLDNGGNRHVDTHNESLARINEINQNITNKQTQNDIDKFNLSMSKLFDRRFFELDLSAREKEVQEFLDTSDTRVSLYNAQIGFARLAMNEAERNDALNKIVNEYQKDIAKSILDAAKDGKSKFDAVLIDWFSKDPSSTLSALSSLSDFKPTIVNKGSKK